MMQYFLLAFKVGLIIVLSGCASLPNPSQRDQAFGYKLQWTPPKKRVLYEVYFDLYRQDGRWLLESVPKADAPLLPNRDRVIVDPARDALILDARPFDRRDIPGGGQHSVCPRDVLNSDDRSSDRVANGYTHCNTAFSYCDKSAGWLATECGALLNTEMFAAALKATHAEQPIREALEARKVQVYKQLLASTDTLEGAQQFISNFGNGAPYTFDPDGKLPEVRVKLAQLQQVAKMDKLRQDRIAAERELARIEEYSIARNAQIQAEARAKQELASWQQKVKLGDNVYVEYTSPLGITKRARGLAVEVEREIVRVQFENITVMGEASRWIKRIDLYRVAVGF